MVNDIIQSIAGNLKEIFPDKKVCAGELTADSEGKFFVIANNLSQKKELDKLRKRSVSFDISYVCRDNDNMDYYEWCSRMYEELEYIKVGSNVLTAINPHCDKLDGIYHFLFDINYRVYYKEDIPKMEKLFVERKI